MDKRFLQTFKQATTEPLCRADPLTMASPRSLSKTQMKSWEWSYLEAEAGGPQGQSRIHSKAKSRKQNQKTSEKCEAL